MSRRPTLSELWSSPPGRHAPPEWYVILATVGVPDDQRGDASGRVRALRFPEPVTLEDVLSDSWGQA